MIEGDSWSSTAEWFIVGKYHSFSFPVALLVEKNIFLIRAIWKNWAQQGISATVCYFDYLGFFQ